MLITRRDPFTGKMVSREINVTPEQMAAWQSGMKIQEAMPNVPAHEREFIRTGITPEKWARIRGIHEPPAPHIVEDWEEEPEQNDLDALFDPTHPIWDETE